ncbi:MAG: hypothetical protein IKU15_00380, partial [Clostridia bacterium]|nr:hypothetical protein [Clostridia bacterium]
VGTNGKVQITEQSQAIGSGGNTNDYNDILNKPQINGIELVGNKTPEDLGINAGIDINYDETNEELTLVGGSGSGGNVKAIKTDNILDLLNYIDGINDIKFLSIDAEGFIEYQTSNTSIPVQRKSTVLRGMYLGMLSNANGEIAIYDNGGNYFTHMFGELEASIKINDEVYSWYVTEDGEIGNVSGSAHPVSNYNFTFTLYKIA